MLLYDSLSWCREISINSNLSHESVACNRETDMRCFWTAEETSQKPTSCVSGNKALGLYSLEQRPSVVAGDIACLPDWDVMDRKERA